MNKIYSILISLIIGFTIGFNVCKIYKTNTTPVDISRFYFEDNFLRVSGMLSYQGNDNFFNSVAKSVYISCNLKTNKCNYNDATYIDNGQKFPPQLYPNSEECNIFDKQHKKIVFTCDGGTIGIIDEVKKNVVLNYHNNNIVYLLQWQ